MKGANSQSRNLWRRSVASGLLWPVLALVTLLLYDLFFLEGFFRFEILEDANGHKHLYGTLVDILNQGSKVMLLAIGMTLVIATGGVDLSVGSLMAVAGAVAALLVTQTQTPFALILVAALALAVVAGFLNGVLVGWIGVQPIVATLILMVTGRGVAMLLTDGQKVRFQDYPALVFVGNGHLLGLPFTVTIVALVLAGTALLTRRTAIGLFIEAVGDNETASRFSGVNSRMVKTSVYAFSGFCAGVAGLIAASNIKEADPANVGMMMELDAIFAVVVGGTALTGGRFSLAGSLVGAVFIQTLTTTMYYYGVPPAIAPVPKAVVIVFVCLLQSERFRRQVTRPFRRATA